MNIIKSLIFCSLTLGALNTLMCMERQSIEKQKEHKRARHDDSCDEIHLEQPLNGEISFEKIAENRTPEAKRAKPEPRPAEALEEYLNLVKPVLPKAIAKRAGAPIVNHSALVKPKALKKQLTFAHLHQALSHYKLLPELPPAAPKMVPNALAPTSCFQEYTQKLVRVLEQGDFACYFSIIKKHSMQEQKRLCSLTFTALNTALHYAAAKGDVNAINTLIRDYGADKEAQNKDGLTPLHVAAQLGKVAALNALIADHHANIEAQNNKGATPLILAAAYNQVAALNALITDHHANTEARSKDGITALHYAAGNGHKEALNALIVIHKANKEAAGGNGGTPLHYAASNGMVAALNTLITDHQVIREPQNKFGNTPLHYAAQNDYAAAINALINDHHANKEAQNKGGDTPLHLAAVWGQVAAINVLIKDHHVNTEAQNNNGNTPLEGAIRFCKAAAATKLLELGAKIRMSTFIQPRGLGLSYNDEMITLLKTSLSTNPEFLSKVDDMCAICHETFINKEKDINSVDFDELIETTCCNKFIHRNCLGNSLMRKPTCPLCRQIPPKSESGDKLAKINEAAKK